MSETIFIVFNNESDIIITVLNVLVILYLLLNNCLVNCYLIKLLLFIIINTIMHMNQNECFSGL